MYKRLLYLMIVLLASSGCASLPEYDPVARSLVGEYPLNTSGFKALQRGMTIEQVHELMGDSLKVGYSLKDHEHYQPQQIPNPFKAEIIKTSVATFVIEYYVYRMFNPDEEITDKHLIPLIFKDGIYIDQGQDALDHLKSLN